MKFDPYSFLRLARDCGITITRHRSKHQVFIHHRTPLDPLWMEAIRIHKSELMKVVPVGHPAKTAQTDAGGSATEWEQVDAFETDQR